MLRRLPGRLFSFRRCSNRRSGAVRRAAPPLEGIQGAEVAQQDPDQGDEVVALPQAVHVGLRCADASAEGGSGIEAGAADPDGGAKVGPRIPVFETPPLVQKRQPAAGDARKPLQQHRAGDAVRRTKGAGASGVERVEVLPAPRHGLCIPFRTVPGPGFGKNGTPFQRIRSACQ